METISMSFRERKRLEVFSRVGLGEMTLVEASEILRLSYRQTKRVWSRYEATGDTGLVHRGRGRASNRQSSGELKEQASVKAVVLGSQKPCPSTRINTASVGTAARVICDPARRSTSRLNARSP